MIGGFGGSSLDRIHYISHWPEQEETSYIKSSLTVPGGMTLNALIASSRLGAPSSYYGALGKDEEGDLLEKYMREKGVATGQSLRFPEGETPVSQIMTTPDGRRTIFHKRGIRGMGYRKELRPRLNGISLLLLDGSWIENSVEWAEEAASRNIPIVLDVSPNNCHPFRDKLISLADYCAISCDLGRKITTLAQPEKQAAALYKSYGGNIIVTHGPEGLWLYNADGPVNKPAFSVKAVDTTGAGDTFHGALAAALYLKQSLPEALDTAMAAAAVKCTGKGHAALPDLEEVGRFIKENKR